MLEKVRRIIRHHWLDERDARRVLPTAAMERIGQRVAASERRHSGEVRICVEVALPLKYLWRGAAARERAVDMFGNLGVWDTEHNNGVLIYLLLADRAIEIVADRGLNRHVSPDAWKTIVLGLSSSLREGRFEDGITQALEEVSGLLMAHFALDAGAVNPNELPDAPSLI